MTDTKSICDWDKKDIEKNLKEIAAQFMKPKYICRKCARVARDERLLCKAVKIKGLL
jgi:hypothetical protein